MKQFPEGTFVVPSTSSQSWEGIFSVIVGNIGGRWNLCNCVYWKLWWEVESRTISQSEHRWDVMYSLEFCKTGIFSGREGTLVGGGIKQFWDGTLVGA